MKSITVTSLSWPPVHSVRRSRRARRASLKISGNKGLEVVLPMRYKLTDALSLLNEKRSWIEKNETLLNQFLQKKKVEELPQEIHLHCINECWKINYSFDPGKSKIILCPQNELRILGNINDIPKCFALLNNWLRKKAKQILTTKLYSLSQQLNLPFNGLSIRNQRTRWGSCSSKKMINLNFKLIFLAPEIVRHIMIHELCHTIHLNHSRKFWQLVAQHDQEWQAHHRISRRLENQLPSWVEA